MQKNQTRGLEQKQKSICVKPKSILANLKTGSTHLPLTTLPKKYIDWINAGRKGMYNKLLNKNEPVHFFSAHLPTIVTCAEGHAFPFNCSNKGIGFIPKKPYLSEYIDLFQQTIEKTKGIPWKDTLEERIKAVSRFYFNEEKIDYRAVTGLEIFTNRTFRNLNHTPLAGLLFTGYAPEYLSFQLNCAVEVIEPDDPRHTFILLARTMFEYDDFHIIQPQFPYAYIFWISEVIDKTPHRVQAKNNGMQHVDSNSKIRWLPEALQSVSRAPAMIQQFIREEIEKYACERGFKEIDLELIQEAKKNLEGHAIPKSAPQQKEKQSVEPYEKIYSAIDGSKLSTEAMYQAVRFGKAFDAELFGCHVYAAKLHDRRFKAMEGGLPEEYQEEQEMERQRKTHDSLITQGLELITDSYLEVMSKLCREQNVPFTGLSLEGRNWQELAKDINSHDYDLIALGSHGVGRVSLSLLGTVAERLLRRVRRDIFICKKTAENNQSDDIVVCLDGSPRSWGALMRGLQLAKAFQKKLIAISAFDPYFHYTMFNCLNEVLTDNAREVFKFEEQEKLHEDIIDSGLAKIYQSHLNIAKRIAAIESIDIETHLLDGKAFEKILDFVKKRSPWLLIIGRIGIHSDEDMDIGGNTENICRLASCNILVTDTQFKPQTEFQAEETVTWTKEAKSKMNKVPPMARGVAIKAIQYYCIAEGYTIVTGSILNAAIKDILPPEAIEKMGITFDDAPDNTKPHEKMNLSFKCTECGHVHHGSRPQSCPICGKEGSVFKLIESRRIEDGVAVNSMGNRQLIWEQDCLDALEKIDDPIKKEQLKNKLEKQAHTRRIATITHEMLNEAAGIAPDFNDEKLVWTDAAIQRLERVPEGFMRNMTKGRIEQWARQHGYDRITLDAINEKYDSWTEGSKNHESELKWSEEALARTGKIPEFIRPMVMKEIERTAKSFGKAQVETDVIEKVLNTWAHSNTFHKTS